MTPIALDLPFFRWLFWLSRQRFRLGLAAALAVASAGALPMHRVERTRLT